MNEQTHPKIPPLTLAETTTKLIESPHMLICGVADALMIVRKFRQIGFSFKRVRKGYWLVLSEHWETNDNQDSYEQRILNFSPFCEAGQSYLLENKKLEFPKLSLNFPPLRDESMIWSSFMRYGPK